LSFAGARVREARQVRFVDPRLPHVHQAERAVPDLVDGHDLHQARAALEGGLLRVVREERRGDPGIALGRVAKVGLEELELDVGCETREVGRGRRGVSIERKFVYDPVAAALEPFLRPILNCDTRGSGEDRYTLSTFGLGQFVSIHRSTAGGTGIIRCRAIQRHK
jgi:hypothetical protein